MAQQKTTRRKSSSNSRRDGRSSSQKPEKYRFAQNVGGDGTMAEREYQRYAKESPQEAAAEADVLLDVPVLKVDQIHLEVDDLKARVAVHAEVRNLLKLSVGVDASLGKVKLDISGVEAQALLKVRLDHIAAVIDRVLTTIDRNPELLKKVGQAAEDVGGGTRKMLAETGEGVEEVGEGAKGGLEGIGKGGGAAIAELGELGELAGQSSGGVGQAAGEASGGAAGKAKSASGAKGGGGDEGDGVAAGDIAKVATKVAAKEVGHAAKLEAKGLKVAASRKAKELGQRRRERKAERHNATAAAMKLADETGVDLDEVKGTGSEGRITVEDVRSAATE